MGVNQNPAKTLIETVWGSNFFDSLPPKWKSSLKMKRYKTPGVPNGTEPDEISEITIDNLMEEIVATSQVTTGRTNELEKITEKIQVALLLTTTTSGQDYDEEFDLVIPFTEHLAINGAEVGDSRKSIRPLNSILSEVKELDLTALETFLETYVLRFPSTTTVDMPDILTGIVIASEPTTGDGTATGTSDIVALSGPYAITIPHKASAQASAAIGGEVIPQMTPFYGVRRSVKNYMFLLPNPVEDDDVTNRLESLTGLTVTNWADFKPGYITIVLIAKRESVHVAAEITWHQTNTNTSFATFSSREESVSREVGMVIKTVRIPPTIHGTITLKDLDGGDLSVGVIDTATATADAETDSFDVGDTQVVPAASATADATAELKVLADGLTATEGATELPTDGLLIVSTPSARPYKYGFNMIHVEVIDADTLA